MNIKPQIISTPSGEELIVLTRAEFEALRAAATTDDGTDDADDIAIFDARMADLASDADKILPAAVSAAILKGDTPLRAIRKWRDMTQLHLAHRTTLAQGYISDLDAGKKSGTVETLKLLATALNVDPAWLIRSQ